MSTYRHVRFDPDGTARGQQYQPGTGRWEDFTAEPVMETIRRALEDDAIAQTLWMLQDGSPDGADSADWSWQAFRDSSPAAILAMYGVARQIVGPFYFARRWGTTLRDVNAALGRCLGRYRDKADDDISLGAALGSCTHCGHSWWVLASVEQPEQPGRIALSDSAVVVWDGVLRCANCNTRRRLTRRPPARAAS